MSEQNKPLAAALALAGSEGRRGWAVYPLRPGDKRPLLEGWPHQATAGVQAIPQWWTRWPEANVGLACGPSRLFVVDMDVKGAADGPASWAGPRAQAGERTALYGNYGRLHEKALRVAGPEDGGRVELRFHAEQLLAAGVLAGHKGAVPFATTCPALTRSGANRRRVDT